MGRYLIISFLAATLVMVGGNPSLGQPKEPEQAAADKVRAGKAFQAQDDHEQALVLFEEAWALSSNPKILFYKARSEFALKRYEEARSTYFLVQEKSRTLEPDKLEEVQRNLEVIRRILDETVLHFVTPGVTGALVSVDATPLGPTPVSKAFRRGTYQVRAALEGYRAAEKLVVVKGEPEITVPLPMERFLTSEEIRWGERSSRLRVAAWTTMGTGVAAFGTGVGFLGNYMEKTTRHLKPNQRVAGKEVDLAVGGTLSVVGVALGVTSAVLFSQSKKPYQAPKVLVTPLPGGAVLDVRF